MKLRTLIVDDSRVLQQVLKKLLEEVGHEVVAVADDACLGLEAYRNHSPQLVLLDITMPNMSGRECLSGILKLNPKAKVIMVSDLSDQALQSDCLSAGAIAFISKDNLSNRELVRQQLAEITQKKFMEAV